jgi:hypothetical protein
MDTIVGILKAGVVLLVGKSTTIPDDAAYPGVIFAVACLLVGGVIVIADVVWVVVLQKASFLKNGYSSVGRSVAICLVWPLLAALFGAVGGLISVFATTKIGAIFAGFSWPIVIRRLVAKENESPEQPVK